MSWRTILKYIIMSGPFIMDLLRFIKSFFTTKKEPKARWLLGALLYMGENLTQNDTLYKKMKASITDEVIKSKASVYVNFCVAQSGAIGTASSDPTSWLTWGEESTEVADGDIMIFEYNILGINHKTLPVKSVGFCIGKHENTFHVLTVRDAVIEIMAVKRENILATRTFKEKN